MKYLKRQDVITSVSNPTSVKINEAAITNSEVIEETVSEDDNDSFFKSKKDYSIFTKWFKYLEKEKKSKKKSD